MDCDRKYGALLSGGLDSTIVCYHLVKNMNPDEKLRTFSIGMPGSTDKRWALRTAEVLGTIHTHFEVTQEEFLEAIPNVIYKIGSWDTTTVRASVGNYLVCKKIRETTDIKVLFNGDGSDEVCGGYA